MSNDDVPVEIIDDSNEEGEYTVEAIRTKRMNPKTKNWEYLIKWENFPESDNTWEPREHLNCPEIIHRFEEDFKNKKRTAKANRVSRTEQAKKKLKTSDNDGASTSGGRTSRRANEPRGGVFVENDDDEDDDDDDDDDDDEDDNDDVDDATRRPNENSSVVRQRLQDTQSEQNKKKGFERGLALSSIISGSLDENDKLWFVVKWEGSNSVEMISYEEMVENASKELCKWYTDRLYWSIDNPNGPSRTG